MRWMDRRRFDEVERRLLRIWLSDGLGWTTRTLWRRQAQLTHFLWIRATDKGDKDTQVVLSSALLKESCLCQSC